MLRAFGLGMWVAAMTPHVVLATDVSVRSKWSKDANRIWVGPDYWANPLQDWRIRDGRLECLTAGMNRNVQLLTQQLTPESKAIISVRLTGPSTEFDGWVGLRFASHGLIDDYRHATIYGKGIDAGWTTDDKLFVGKKQVELRAVDRVQAGGVATLQLSLTPGNGYHTVELKLLGDRDHTLGSVTTQIESVAMYGNIALVCHSNKRRLKPQLAYAQQEPIATFHDWQVSGSHFAGGEEQAWGPILWCQYTLSRSVLKLSAQFPPLGPLDSKEAQLQVRRDGDWRSVASAEIDRTAHVALFRVADWTESENVRYRVQYDFEGQQHNYEGVIKHDPIDKSEVVVAGFTGNKDYAFPNREIVTNVKKLNVDLLFFSGDQIYETNGGFGIVRTPFRPAVLDYLHKWYLFGWSFGNLLRNQPSVHLPDDHDVYQGNIWGQGGRRTERIENGGYLMPPAWVNMVQRTQTAHLPDPYDPRPAKQGISVYFTDLRCGRMSFAVLEDRKFKAGPNSKPGIVKNSDEATLLGERQLKFLREWAADWRDCDMKATLSQTVFAQCHTHGGKTTSPMRRDTDANGWPQAARNRALREIRKGIRILCTLGTTICPTVSPTTASITWGKIAGRIISTVPVNLPRDFPRAWWAYPAWCQSPRRVAPRICGAHKQAPGVTR